jgi:hypothetical protein
MCGVLSIFTILVTSTVSGRVNLTGYWKFSVPNGGTSYLELKQEGETVTIAPRGFMRPGLAGMIHDGKMHLEGSSGPGGKTTLTYDAIVGEISFPFAELTLMVRSPTVSSSG